MARFVLQPCKLREDRFVPIKDAENEEFTWRELAAKLAPTATIKALRTLYHVQSNAYLGLLKHPKDPSKQVNFCYVSSDRSGIASAIIKRDPSFERRLLLVYRVVEVDRGIKLSEPQGTVPFPTPAGAPQ